MAVLAVALAAAGTLLLVSGLSVAIAHNGRRAKAESESKSLAAQRSAQSPEGGAVKPAETPKPTVQEVPTVATPAPSAPPAGASKPAAKPKSTKPASAPTKKPAKSKGQSGIVARKCGPCHSNAQLSAGQLDIESATSSVDGMIAGKYLKLTPQEREAVIAALSGD